MFYNSSVVSPILVSFRFFVEDDRTAHREPESILQKQKMDRIEIEDFYTAVRINCLMLAGSRRANHWAMTTWSAVRVIFTGTIKIPDTHLPETFK